MTAPCRHASNGDDRPVRRRKRDGSFKEDPSQRIIASDELVKRFDSISEKVAR
jgi:hypothetical protein